MGKKETIKNIYEMEQNNKKHRTKSKKLEKREHKRKNKKKLKEERNKINKLEKYVKLKFKADKQRFESSKLGIDLPKIRKLLKKMKKVSETAEEEVPEIVKYLESGSDVDIASLENSKVQKYMGKLLNSLQFNISPKNPYLFSKNPEFQFSRLTITKAVFEFLKKENKEKNKEVDEEEANDVELPEESYDQDIQDAKNENNKVKDELDYEFDYLEEKVGKNTKLINKAFTKMLNNRDVVQNKNQSEDEDDDEVVGPPAPQFLSSTLRLLDGEDEAGEEKKISETKPETIDQIVKRTTLQPSKPSVKESIKIKKEPINKDSYYRLIEEEKKRQEQLEEDLEEYESIHRAKSLLQIHQDKRAKEKRPTNMDDFMMRPFDKESDFIKGSVDSKRALKIMRENNGLNSRFEAKDKYVGY